MSSVSPRGVRRLRITKKESGLSDKNSLPVDETADYRLMGSFSLNPIIYNYSEDQTCFFAQVFQSGDLAFRRPLLLRCIYSQQSLDL